MKKDTKIRVVAYVHVGDELVNVDELTPEQKTVLAAKLQCAGFNEIYRGRAEMFFPGITEPSPAAREGIRVDPALVFGR